MPSTRKLCRVAILDMGGQYIDLVKKAVERQGFPADVLASKTPFSQLQSRYGAIIISGSPANSSNEADLPYPDPQTLDQQDIPILGICYGMQVMAKHFGGSVQKGSIREDGRFVTVVDTTHPLFKGAKKEQSALFTHGDFVTDVPSDFRIIGQHQLADGTRAISSIARGSKVGVQFHPEVFDDTPEGYEIFRRFLCDIADLVPDPAFTKHHLNEFVAKSRAQLRTQAAGRDVIAFVSGGVDSSVALTLASKAIPAEKLHAFYIDNGLMRNEDNTVIEMLSQAGIDVQRYDATKLFLNALRGGVDPQEKRHTIGRLFVEVQNKILTELNLKEALLLQGTNAADRIESGYSKGSQHTETIKTHHNQVAEIQELKARGLLLEPLDDLFKDEVRAVGMHLGLPEDMVHRQPFPGPGLAIRIICSQKTTGTDSSLNQRLVKYVKEQDPAYRAALLPMRSVGVGGDERSYSNACLIWGVNDSADIRKLGTKIPAHFRGAINRVLFRLADTDATALIHPTPTSITKDSLVQLRAADHIVLEEMRAHKILRQIQQCPVGLLPFSLGKLGERTIVIRPVQTSTFMTVQAMLPDEDLPFHFFEACERRIISEVQGIHDVFFDATNKPPATTEFE